MLVLCLKIDIHMLLLMTFLVGFAFKQKVTYIRESDLVYHAADAFDVFLFLNVF